MFISITTTDGKTSSYSPRDGWSWKYNASVLAVIKKHEKATETIYFPLVNILQFTEVKEE